MEDNWKDLLKEQARIAKFAFAFRYFNKILKMGNGIKNEIPNVKPQKDHAKVIGVSFQQVHKIEKTDNGLSADKLFLLCRKKGYDIGLMFNSNPEEVLQYISPKYHKKVLAHFKLVDERIKKEYKQQLIYRPRLAGLEKEMRYEKTFKVW